MDSVVCNIYCCMYSSFDLYHRNGREVMLTVSELCAGECVPAFAAFEAHAPSPPHIERLPCLRGLHYGSKLPHRRMARRKCYAHHYAVAGFCLLQCLSFLQCVSISSLKHHLTILVPSVTCLSLFDLYKTADWDIFSNLSDARQ